MYGKRRYGRINKSVEQPIVANNSEPTFICPKCHSIRNQSLGYADITYNKINIPAKLNFRVCYYCLEALTAWIKG